MITQSLRFYKFTEDKKSDVCKVTRINAQPLKDLDLENNKDLSNELNQKELNTKAQSGQSSINVILQEVNVDFIIFRFR